ncbi:fatty acid synthase subunit beta domain-containing protein [Corynebacterium casei]|uniref:fatty acid synthase subunit beta domain-containing protein n=1 Tax=Corynebacterium casei TaxID=160386 RepID=UPI003FD41D06
MTIDISNHRLVNRLETENFALSFSGQGFSWLPTLRNVIAGGNGAQVTSAVDGAKKLLEPVADELAAALPHGFDPMAWAANAEDPAWDLSDSSISTPGIVVAQFGLLESLKTQGLDVAAAVAHIGHSQGALATYISSERAQVAEVIALAQLIGVAISKTARATGLIRTAAGSPMVSIAGISREQLDKVIAKTGVGSVIGLQNNRNTFVIVGTPEDNNKVIEVLEKLAEKDAKAIENKERGGKPFAPRINALAVQSGYHHPAMQAAVEMVTAWSQQIGLDESLAHHGAQAVLTSIVDWPQEVQQAVDAGAQWILECGPDKGMAALTKTVVAGQGIGVQVVSTDEGQAELFDAGQAPQLPLNFAQFAPKTFEDNGVTRLSTRFTERTGYSPVILAGMTPSTVDPAIVAAAANAGFWAELAGGGQVTEAILNDSLERLEDMLNPGINAQFNAMYLSPKQWRTQIEGRRLIPRARANGASINGVVCSAGIPPHEEALALVRQLHEDNIPWVAFKPGAVRQVKKILDIADDLPESTIIMQVEGGKAGGHHSWEDLDDLLIETYADIRERDNVVLMAAGGIGAPERGAQYLTGEWSKVYGLPDMPVDAVMIGTAAMATLESTASESVKQALVSTQGLEDIPGGGWVPAGGARDGIASGRSQLGADIHEIDNTFAKAGRLLDEVAGDAEAVAARREEIIAAIAGTAKPYFGDLESMTYAEWLSRYLEVSYMGSWVDASWARRFEQMIARTEARLTEVDHGEFEAQVVVDAAKPERGITDLVAAYPAAEKHTVIASDVAWFIDLLRGKGKPPAFVPVIDSDVRRWWRQDSLWQAHDERYTAEQVGIIPGTTAVAGITKANEPVAELLARFESAAVNVVLASENAEDAEPANIAGTALERVLAAKSVEWAGRQRPNPVAQVSESWTLDAEGTSARAEGAELITVDAENVELTVNLAGSVAGAQLTLRITVPADAPLSSTPIITAEAAEESMAALAGVAAGGTLPEVTDGKAIWKTTLNPAALADYAGVTTGYIPSAETNSAIAPDVIVGRAWPAVFAVIANAVVPGTDSARVVEGLLNLVHLEHNLRLHQALPTEAVELTVTATGGEVRDTLVGRVVEVSVSIDIDGAAELKHAQLATLEERFAIVGRTGEQDLEPVNSTEHITDTPSSFRHQMTVTAPASMHPFAVVTGDRNPIHVSDAAARLAGLDNGIIVHGMWTSAIAQLAAGFDGVAVAEWSANMLSPVLPGASVDFIVERTGLDSRPLAGEVRTVTASVDGDVVLQATATMAAPRTFYGFPGQGIQSQGMGMDSYASSAAARDVWERADAHTRSKLGFSILEIVRNNPPLVVVDGEEFTHPDGALFLTQFTQVAMATLGCAQIAELAEAGVKSNDTFFAGHSVGEYNALAAYAQVLSLEAVVEIVYARGLTMHRLVDRDAQGNSNYGLAALRPNKIGVRADDVFDYVAKVSEASGEFLEIVNYNIAGVQYAVAGTRAGLAALAADAESRAPGQRAFIMIPGIDVPFHSSHLLGGVDNFRAHLDSLIPQQVDLDVLRGRYIPNLVARPFELTREFVEAMAEVVDSKYVYDILADFDKALENPVQLGRTLLIELLAWQFASPVRWIETQDLLLSDTGATAGAGTAGLGVERFVEIGVGSSPTLANMLGQTLRLPQYAGNPIEVLNVERDRATVFAEDAIERPQPETSSEIVEEAATATAQEVSAANAAPAAAAPAPVAAAPAATAPAGGGSTPDDKAFSAADATEMLIAIWTKVRPDQMGAADTIELLVEGVSSRRNQLLLDLGVEFGLGAIEGAADAEIAALKDQVAGMAKGYKAFGPVLSVQVSDSLRRITGPAGKKPAYIAQRVTETWGLGTGWVDRVTAELVLGAREGASIRGGDLALLSPANPGSTAELDALIDAAVDSAGAKVGIVISKPSAGGGAGVGVVDSAALDAYSEKMNSALANTARTLLAQLGQQAPVTEFAEADDNQAIVDLVAAELGADWPRLVAPSFDADKTVQLDDRWASAREDLVRLAHGELDSLDITGAGEEAAAMAEYLGLESQAAQARVAASTLEHDGEVAVVTGGSPGSIASEVVANLLREGATVIATTSRLGHDRLEFYKNLYRTSARGNAQLWVVPANLNSFADLDAVIDWIGNEQTATVGGSSKLVKPAMVPNLLFPFAAPRVQGTLADAGAPAEAQMRLLLWSVEKLIAGLSQLGTGTHVGQRLHVVLPGSPNRGRFGGDGAYGESKAALDALVTRWHAEPVWGDRTSIVHAHIGWVRGTGLMGGNDPLVDAVEAKGVRTYSNEEMAQKLVGEGASVSKREEARTAPVTLDFTGDLGQADINLPELARSLAAQPVAEEATEAPVLRALPNIRERIAWTTPDFAGVNQKLDDMVVIVGAGEIGPVGSSRTRFEVEMTGDLSAAGVIELAWTTGLIAWDDAAGAWFDADGEEIAEEDIYSRFHDEVLANVGVRKYHDDYGPNMPMVDNLAPELTTIYLERDMTFAVQDEETARTFVADVEGATAHFDGEEWQVTRPAGSEVRVPRRVAMTRFVGGQVPQGFNPGVYGIPADMIDNLDRVALWNLVCSVDAFLAAGFSPAELLSHVHPARVSSTQGTGMGGMQSMRSLYLDKLLAQPRPNDILQEALPNVVAAHVMQSYVGGYGQMVHPVAACTTAAVSVEEGMDKLRLRKTDFVVAGGIDDLSIEGITGFGDMAATADSSEMEDKGIDHKYFSRANDRRRGGFIESEGGGTILMARGSLAAELGLPVLGVVGFAESFADGAHTSIPAPGLGALSAARGGADSRLAQGLDELGVGVNEIAVISKHDTSTNANDPNESDLHERIAASMGRDKGNPLFIISQKTLTGHAKGGAAAFQLVGLTQVLRNGVLPPNRSLDCVDPVLRRHSHLTWLREQLDLRATPPKAGLVTSLGFGHVSALVAVVHPGAFLQALRAERGEQAAKRWQEASSAREAAGLQRLTSAISGGAALYERPVDRNLGGSGDAVKEREAAILLDHDARLRGNLLEPGADSK